MEEKVNSNKLYIDESHGSFMVEKRANGSVDW